MFGDSYVYRRFRRRHGSLLGAIAGYWSTCSRLPAAFRKMYIRLSARMPRCRLGIRIRHGRSDRTGTAWLICVAYRIGGSDTQLETVPGVAEVASIGGFVREYQVQLDPHKLLAYNIPLSTVIDRVKASTNEVGGRVLELSGAQYMIRGLGYLHSLDDLASVARGQHERNSGNWCAMSDVSALVLTFARAPRNGMAKAKPSAASSSCARDKTR